MADLFKTAGADRLMAVDLHTAQIQGFFDGPVDHLLALPILADYVAREVRRPATLAVVSPDAGRIRVAERWSDRLGGAPLAFIHKTRDLDRPNEVVANRVVGEVEGRICVLVDDMIDTGGTIVQGGRGAAATTAPPDVVIAATHAILSGPAVDRLKNCPVERGRRHQHAADRRRSSSFDKLTVLSIAPLIARAIRRSSRTARSPASSTATPEPALGDRFGGRSRRRRGRLGRLPRRGSSSVLDAAALRDRRGRAASRRRRSPRPPRARTADVRPSRGAAHRVRGPASPPSPAPSSARAPPAGIRRADKVPAVLYGHGTDPRHSPCRATS